jgi:hypothetical protein
MHQMTLPVREERLESAEGTMSAALTWIANNDAAWNYIVMHARMDANPRDGRPGRVRVKAYLEAVRQMRTMYATERIKVPNSFSAAFTRILWEWEPDLRNAIPRASSKLDGLVVPPRSHQ